MRSRRATAQGQFRSFPATAGGRSVLLRGCHAGLVVRPGAGDD
ncbi:hypothetical protein HD595_000242 [Nonomuraea roseoviolacea subsp. carminata]|uniref:Uncharacterized protein n=1 Tax=Nonomuraea roseoviolacea subsp. carminata TaxID=160689 RepID=A0ABT1JQW9_9ACTN|nr:hypothetical protein [Nonomuraea roseoviolacea subsp. carminata]